MHESGAVKEEGNGYQSMSNRCGPFHAGNASMTLSLHKEHWAELLLFVGRLSEHPGKERLSIYRLQYSR